VLFALLLAGCVGYSLMEHYLCVSPAHLERCKHPPFSTPLLPESRTKDDAVTPP
jgi:hypothetical protein